MNAIIHTNHNFKHINKDGSSFPSIIIISTPIKLHKPNNLAFIVFSIMCFCVRVECIHFPFFNSPMSNDCNDNCNPSRTYTINKNKNYKRSEYLAVTFCNFLISNCKFKSVFNLHVRHETFTRLNANNVVFPWMLTFKIIWNQFFWIEWTKVLSSSSVVKKNNFCVMWWWLIIQLGMD